MEPAALEILNSLFRILKGETGDAGTAQKACVLTLTYTWNRVEPRGTTLEPRTEPRQNRLKMK